MTLFLLLWYSISCTTVPGQEYGYATAHVVVVSLNVAPNIFAWRVWWRPSCRGGVTLDFDSHLTMRTTVALDERLVGLRLAFEKLLRNTRTARIHRIATHDNCS